MTENEAVGATALEPVPVAETQPKEATEADAAETPVGTPDSDAGAAPQGRDAEGDDDGGDPGKPKKKGGFQRQIERVTREKYQAELRAAEAERRLAEASGPKATAETPGDMPRIENFTTIEDYNKAVQKWRDDSVAFAEQRGAERARTDADRQGREREAQAARASLEAKQAATALKHPDYYAAVNPVAHVIMGHPVLSQYVLESDLGADVAYHLATNLAKLDEIARMAPIAAGRELYKLEARLNAPPPPKPTTKAPDPIRPVGANEKVQRSYADMSMDEYARKRREERRKTKG